MSMNWHPTDEDLILHFYGESGADDRRRVDGHLQVCASCRLAWTELGDTLKLVDQAAMPEPGPEFERVMWARVQQALPAPRRSAWTIRVLLPMAATILVSAFAGGYLWRTLHRPPANTATQVAATAPATARSKAALSERVLLTALDDHFQQTQTLLIELKNAPEDATDFAFERAAADDLISSGRLYRVMARQNGDRQMADMLEDLEAVLLDVARSSDRVEAHDLQALRARIESQDLLFKVRSATRQVHERQKDLLTSANDNE
jgi:hypothetical protein